MTQVAQPDRNRGDAEIRGALLERLGDRSSTAVGARWRCRPRRMVVQEWSIDGAVVDVATVDHSAIAAFEIKSARDSVSRLPGQVESYGLVFDRCTLVTADSHLAHAKKILPSWWGIWLWRDGDIVVDRSAGQNPDNNVARLLWSDELSKLVRTLGLRAEVHEEQKRIDQSFGLHIGCGASCKRRPTKPAMMAAIKMSPTVREHVATAICARDGWRLDNGRSARNY